MLGCYRTADAHDPETYLAGVIAVLARYPMDVVAEVTDPVAGLPSTQTFLPSLSEVRAACERAHERKKGQDWRAENLKKQLEERDRREQEELSQRPGESFDRCMEELAAVGLRPGPRKVRIELDLESKVSPEQWAALPATDAPSYYKEFGGKRG